MTCGIRLGIIARGRRSQRSGARNSDADTNIKISDYRCDLNKGFFTSSPFKGIEQLVDEILKKAKQI